MDAPTSDGDDEAEDDDDEEVVIPERPVRRRDKINKGSLVHRSNSFRDLNPDSGSNSSGVGMTNLERLIRTHPIWFLPSVDSREEIEQLLSGKEQGVSSLSYNPVLYNGSFRLCESTKSYCIAI